MGRVARVGRVRLVDRFEMIRECVSSLTATFSTCQVMSTKAQPSVSSYHDFPNGSSTIHIVALCGFLTRNYKDLSLSNYFKQHADYLHHCFNASCLQ